MNQERNEIMEEYVIETKDLSKYFGKHRAVNQVNMHVRKGCIYGLIGRNGAGKTTIMKMLTGLSSQSEGDIVLFGQTKRNNEMYRRMGTLIENPGLFYNMSAWENMKCKAICMGIADYSERIDNNLKLVGLDPKEGKNVKKYSLGMKQRLGIALALLGNPDVLILDEPINGLDPQGIVEIRETLQKLQKDKNMTIIISSHILEELSKLVDFYGIIDNGHLIEEISKEQLLEKCRERIEVITPDTNMASTVIERIGIHNYCVVDKNIIQIYEQLDNSAFINRELVNAGIEVCEIMKNSESIENYYLSKTGGKSND